MLAIVSIKLMMHGITIATIYSQHVSAVLV